MTCLAAVAATPGYIQVTAPPGLEIYLDDKAVGVTKEALKGLLIPKVAPGSHVLKAMRGKNIVREIRVAVAPGRVLLCDISDASKNILIKEGGEQAKNVDITRTGSLVIQSLPVACRLDIPDLEIEGYHKQADPWRLLGVPIGEYLVILSRHFTYTAPTGRWPITQHRTSHSIRPTCCPTRGWKAGCLCI